MRTQDGKKILAKLQQADSGVKVFNTPNGIRATVSYSDGKADSVKILANGGDEITIDAAVLMQVAKIIQIDTPSLDKVCIFHGHWSSNGNDRSEYGCSSCRSVMQTEVRTMTQRGVAVVEENE